MQGSSSFFCQIMLHVWYKVDLHGTQMWGIPHNTNKKEIVIVNFQSLTLT